MPSDYDWDLPSFDSSDSSESSGYDLTSSGDESGSYDFGGGSAGDFNFEDDDWYVDSTGGGAADVETSMFDDIWGWVKSDQGVSVLGGAAKGALQLWLANQAAELKKGSGAGGAGGPSAAELYDARVKTHNASINRPMDMGLTKLVRK